MHGTWYMFNFPYLHLNPSIRDNHCVLNRSSFNIWLVTQPTQHTYNVNTKYAKQYEETAAHKKRHSNDLFT